METHRKLTVIGVFLLAATFLINSQYQGDHSLAEFNYAYITGIAMLACFGISFVLFTKDRIND